MSGEELTLLLPNLMMVGLLIVILAIIAVAVMPRKTKNYRKDISNLYVAGRIRQIASKNGISIADEYDTYKKWVKKLRIEDQSLDNTIEESLQSQITDDYLDFTDKKGK